MTRNEFNQAIADISAVARFHQQMTAVHRRRDCAFCQSLDERRRELAARWGYAAAPTAAF